MGCIVYSMLLQLNDILLRLYLFFLVTARLAVVCYLIYYCSGAPTGRLEIRRR